MNIITKPEPFSPVFGEIIYTLSLTEEEKGEEINMVNSSDSKLIGTKKATEFPEFSLNVADYFKTQADIKPQGKQDCAIFDNTKRVCYSKITNKTLTSTTAHLPGICPAKNKILREDNYEISENEQDEISWISSIGPHTMEAVFETEGEEPLKITIGKRSIIKETIYTAIINANHIGKLLNENGKKWEDFDRFTVNMYNINTIRMIFQYKIKPHNCRKTRIAWWNKFGAIDFYSFETTLEITDDAEGNQTDKEYFKTNIKRKKTVATTADTLEKAKWISGILAAPQVWVEENDDFIPINITNKKNTVYNPDNTTIKIEFEYDAVL